LDRQREERGMTGMIYHMCPAETWQEAVRAGTYRGTADDLRDGFIHFSTADQIAESARRHRAGQAGLVLIAIESAPLGNRLKWEEARGGALFPHLYGALNPAEVASVRPLPLGPDGEHVFPPLD
jgi:uncharacterized protein (DUF952 family)